MAEVKNKRCTTLEPVTDPKNPRPTCPGTVIRYESPLSKGIMISGVFYATYEQCQRCGQAYPG